MKFSLPRACPTWCRWPKDVCWFVIRRLAKLLARSFPAVAVVAHERKSDAVPPTMPIAVDAQIPAGSVPNYLRRSADDFPTRDRYLLADPKQKRQWRGRFETLGPGPKIGISWFGGGTSEERRHRTTKLAEWRDVLAVGGAQFINLQYGNCADELQSAAAPSGITIHQFAQADPLGDLDAFAAKVAALDLVISIGNATVHLAGALGVPTWCLVPFVPQWRWSIAGETTPWYPSVQIIRQTAGYDWTSALAETANRLKAFIAHPRRNDPAPRSGKSNIATPAVRKPEPSKRNDSPTTLVRQATQLFNENRIDEAAQIAEQILKLDSANVPAIRILGVAARKAQQFERSLELLSRAVELAPGSAAVHFEQGLTFAEMKQQRDAYDCFVKSTQCKPPLQPAFVNISAILEQQERYEESLQWARKAIELKSDCPLGHYNLANSLRECGRIADAIVQYELAVKYRPDYAKAKWNLGICHVLLGQLCQGMAIFRIARCGGRSETRSVHATALGWHFAGRQDDCRSRRARHRRRSAIRLLFRRCHRTGRENYLGMRAAATEIVRAIVSPSDGLRLDAAKRLGANAAGRTHRLPNSGRKPASLFSQSSERFSSARTVSLGRPGTRRILATTSRPAWRRFEGGHFLAGWRKSE